MATTEELAQQMREALDTVQQNNVSIGESTSAIRTKLDRLQDLCQGDEEERSTSSSSSSSSPSSSESSESAGPTPQPSRMTVAGRNFMWGNDPISLVGYTAWPFMNESPSEIASLLTQVKDMGYNCIHVRLSLRFTHDINLEYALSFMEQTKNMGLWVSIGFGIYWFDIGKYKAPASQIHPTNQARAQAINAANILKPYNHIAFLMADALDARLPHDAAINNALVRGLKEGDPSRLVTCHPLHGHTSKDIPNVDFQVLHSGHSHGKNPDYVHGLYNQVRSQHNGVIYNIEPLYEADAGFWGGTGATASEVFRITRVDEQLGAGVTFGQSNVVIWDDKGPHRISTNGAKGVAQIGKTLPYYKSER